MKLEKFAAEQLSKKEMNQLKGGARFYCKCFTNPPITWEANYSVVVLQYADIESKCKSAGGTCSAYPTDL